MNERIFSVAIRHEQDVVLARQRARQIARLLDFDGQDQTRIATAVSEIVRNAFRYAGGGSAEFHLTGRTPPQALEIRVVDEGRGIPNLATILEGRYRSETGLGLGLIGTRRLMDHFDIQTMPERGTTVVMTKLLPRHAALRQHADLASLAAELARDRPGGAADELQQQNQELLRALDELSRRQEDLLALNNELEDTNRGVVALYAELDERADHLRRADDLKSRFLSNMSHEFRTPVNSIQALSRILLDRLDGELTTEQERQVTFIRKAADSLAELVNDLLDLARVEAGKTVVRPVEFDVETLFSALRGMLRPLLLSESVSLVFDEPETVPPLRTDEAKVSQILRNFVSNALKFTERGEVRVSARQLDGGRVEFTVADTGIGIAPEHHELIFQEFSQVESPVQRRVKGTGLGLPLCRKLAELLGGSVGVDSTPQLGATFRLEIPAAYSSDEESIAAASFHPEPGTIPVLLVEDNEDTAHVYARYVAGTPYRLCHVRTLRAAREALTTFAPRAIVLDLLLHGEDSWPFLTELKRRPETAEIPVIVASTLEDEGKGRALGADAYCVKPVDRNVLLGTLQRLVDVSGLRKVLIVDDEEISRYLLRQTLTRTPHLVFEASNGEDGLRLAGETHPDLVCLDLTMPGMDGAEVLRRLKDEPTTREIPVVVVTSSALDDAMRAKLLERAAAVLSKEQVANLVAIVDRALGDAGAAASLS